MWDNYYIVNSQMALSLLITFNILNCSGMFIAAIAMEEEEAGAASGPLRVRHCCRSNNMIHARIEVSASWHAQTTC